MNLHPEKVESNEEKTKFLRNFRLFALFKVMNRAEKQIYRFADVEVNTSQNCLKRGNREEHLRQKAFFVLVHLLEQRGRVVTKNELMEIIWKDTAVTDDALVQCIKEIRRSIGDNTHQPRFIKTVPKSGYRFIGTIEEPKNGFHAPPVGLIPENKEIIRTFSTFSIRGFIGGRKVFLAILFFAVTIFLLGFLGKSAWQEQQNAADVTLPQIAGKKSLAVMYFENQTGGAELDWMREGLADMLITNLSRSNKISVLSRQQFHLLLEKNGFQPNNEIPFEQTINIARKSRAESFITGSFVKINEKIRIDVQLHDTNNGALLATESLIVERAEQILTEIDLLSLKLVKYLGADEPENQTNFADVMTDNLEAYRYYSLAVEKTQALHNKEAIELLEKAVALDPQFAMAYARIGYAFSISWGQAEKGKPYLEKAFKLSERLSEKDRLNIKAWYEIANLDFPSAIQTFREIIAKYPLETESYWRLGRVLEGEERLNEAVEVLKQGLTIDPEAKNIYNTLGGVYSELGRHAEAVAARQRYVALAPSEANAFDSLGLAYQWSGDYGAAIANYNRALELNPNFEIALVHLANTRFQMGQYRTAESLFRRYIEIAPSEGEKERGWNCLALIYLKKRDFASAEKAADTVLKINKDSIWYAFITAAEKGDAARTKKLEESVLVKIRDNERGARSNQRFDFYLRGHIALKKGQIDEAINHFQEALKRKPPIWNIESYEDALANAYFQIGRIDDAIAEYQRILKLNPNYPLARFHLAQALEQKGLKEEARAEYLHFLEIWREADEDIPEIIIARKSLNQG